MPLPAALAARLARRGFIGADEVKKEEEVEEVFAEDYDSDEDDDEDDDDEEVTTKHEPHSSAVAVYREEEDMEDGRLIFDKLDCPNRRNTYHKCTDFCRSKWGKKRFVHDPSCDKKRDRLLRKYPLPEGWEEVGDPDTGRYYYWNMMTDQVSWLPPQHPRAKVTFPEVDIKSKLDAIGSVHHAPRPAAVERVMQEEPEDDIDNLDDLDDPELLLERELEKRASGRHDRRKGGRGRNKDLEELDPMDPASYSDIPRGTWSSGLEIQASAKTGVDVTASGPLFQQRPYPNPGAVLRANREMDKK